MRQFTMTTALAACAAFAGGCGPATDGSQVVASSDPAPAAASSVAPVSIPTVATIVPDSVKPMETRLRVESSAFPPDGQIPAKYAADAENVSPPLSWSGAPKEAKSYALVMDDPDAAAGVWTHWVIWNVPNTRLDEDVPKSRDLPSGAAQGLNSSKKLGYAGPQPPAGTTHRYVFHVYALDARLDLAGGATKEDLMTAMHGHVIGTGELTGRYGRAK